VFESLQEEIESISNITRGICNNTRLLSKKKYLGRTI